jgi:hypothetical protein
MVFERKMVECLLSKCSEQKRRLRMCGWSTLVPEQKKVEDVWSTLVPEHKKVEDVWITLVHKHKKVEDVWSKLVPEHKKV